MPDPTSVRWTTRNKPVHRETIARVEQSWQIRFPAEYLALAMDFDGGHPEHDAITLPGGATRYFLALSSYERDSQDHIVRHWSACFERLPSRVYPFADDGGGNPFTFDFRDPSAPPSIWWYDHETEDDNGTWHGVQVAPDFAGFLNLLHADTSPAEPEDPNPL